MNSNDGNSSDKPLTGIKVLDIATFVAAPFAAASMAEFGAEVIKIEKPGVGDSLRNLGTESETGDSWFWVNEARNKKCITLDLKQPKGAELFRAMVAQTDIVIENFRPGTLERWGLGFEELQKINPGLIMLRISAYGQEGPKKDLPGFARIAQAYAGLTYLTGTQQTAPLIAGSTTLADYLSGLYGAYGIMLALRTRDQSGIGQIVDIALHDGIFRFLDEIAAVYDKTGHVRERMGTETDSSCPHSHYPTADGKWVAIACTNDKMFSRLADVMKLPELADEKHWGLKDARLANRDEVNATVSQFTSSLTREELIQLCSDGDVPCGPVCSIADIFEEEQFAVRDTLTTVVDSRVGSVRTQGVVPKLSRTPGEIKHLGKAMGADTQSVLQDWLGVDETEYLELSSQGVV